MDPGKKRLPKIKKLSPEAAREQSMRNHAAVRGISYEEYKAEVEKFNENQNH